MPTYEYLCVACEKRYEKREGFDAPARQKCQYCGKMASRILHAPPIVFKGTGFYKTDSRGTSKASTDGARSDDSKPEPAKPQSAAASEKRAPDTTEAAAAS